MSLKQQKTYNNNNNNTNNSNIIEQDDIDMNVLQDDAVSYEKVFSLNQLLFPILLYIGFPACLYLSAVTQSWRVRIWPNQVLSHQQWIGKMSRYRGKRKCIEWKTVKDAVPLKTQSLVSSEASLGSYVRKATFTRFPRTKCRLRNILHQLFVTYPKLKEITINPTQIKDANFDINTFKIFLQYWNLHWVSSRKLNLKNTCVLDLCRKRLDFSDIVVYVENSVSRSNFGFIFTMETLHLHFTNGMFLSFSSLEYFFEKLTRDNEVKIFEISFGTLTIHDKSDAPANIELFSHITSRLFPLKRLKISTAFVQNDINKIPITVNWKPEAFPNLESLDLSEPFVACDALAACVKVQPNNDESMTTS